MCKKSQNIFIMLKKTCWVFYDVGEQGDVNETGLKEGGVIEMSTTVLPYTRCSLSFAFCILLTFNNIRTIL